MGEEGKRYLAVGGRWRTRRGEVGWRRAEIGE